MRDTSDNEHSSGEQPDKQVRLTVEFTQTFTVECPGGLDAEHAEDWWRNHEQEALWDVVSAKQGDSEVLDVTEVDE